MITQVLNGHTSEETAYLVPDHPCGYRVRCKIRYWLETPKKGVYKSKTRFVSQTTNPKWAKDVWNKPKVTTYGQGFVLLYLDEKEHVQHIDLTYRSSYEWLQAALDAPGLTEEHRLSIQTITLVKRNQEAETAR